MKRTIKIFAAASICSLIAVSAHAAGTKKAVRLCERQMQQAAQRYDVPLGILYAVGLTETGRKDSLHPYALNIAGKPYFAQNASQALAAIKSSQKRGIKLIDVGCMQINVHYHRDKFASLKAMLDPAQNVRYAARFLAELKQREKSWTMAVARYHAGPDNDPAQKRYVCRVINNIVAAGYGRWTPNSLKFCK
ncbi:lytic transglycosylase [Pseudovibrio japonicus]|uniref:Lytic transglycosylase n=1 Tax=Pseudovibrio japonicus TaxID=366534 RepID=A0ABQ3DZC3_9HYPH|nr:transglycosylase SLT domain-containing protein [Pseudovibrio japonicus]GHB18480.1 lytic transglycosylase [Pseudovibrio japonicus]